MQKGNSAESEKNLSKVIKIDEARIKNHLGEMVRSTVEETLNDMLNAEAPSKKHLWRCTWRACLFVELRILPKPCGECV